MSTKQAHVLELRRVMAGIVVDDLERARSWYEAVLGRPADAAPMGGLLEWHFNGEAWLQVVEVQIVRAVQQTATWGAAGASAVSFVIANLDDQLAVLRAYGIPIVSQYETKAFAKTASVRDPAGNFVTFVEEASQVEPA